MKTIPQQLRDIASNLEFKGAVDNQSSVEILPRQKLTDPEILVMKRMCADALDEFKGRGVPIERVLAVYLAVTGLVVSERCPDIDLKPLTQEVYLNIAKLVHADG